MRDWTIAQTFQKVAKLAYAIDGRTHYNHVEHVHSGYDKSLNRRKRLYIDCLGHSEDCKTFKEAYMDLYDKFQRHIQPEGEENKSTE
jgi:hypothetical protein